MDRRNDGFGGNLSHVANVLFLFFAFVGIWLGSLKLAFEAGRADQATPQKILVFESQEANIWACPDGSFEISKEGEFFPSKISYSEACELASEIFGKDILLAPYGKYVRTGYGRDGKVLSPDVTDAAGVDDGMGNKAEVVEFRFVNRKTGKEIWARVVKAPLSEKE